MADNDAAFLVSTEPGDTGQPSVCVIIPVYNTESYLRRCLDSVRNQTYHNIEVILVDDASPDGCPAICDVYAAADQRFHVIHKVTCEGASAARNTGLDYLENNTDCEYICFIDSDDAVSEFYVESLLALLQKYSCDMGHVADTGDMEELGTTSSRVVDYAVKNYQFHRDYSKYVVWGMMFHRRLLKGGLRFNPALKYNEDFLFNLGLVKNKGKEGHYAISNRVLYYHESNRSDALTKHSTEEELHDSWVQIFYYLSSVYPEYKPYLYMLANSYQSLMAYDLKHDNKADYKSLKKECGRLLLPLMFSDASFPIKCRFFLIRFGIMI